MYLLPSFFVLTIPMSLLLAILVSFGRISVDGEYIAMKASGISLYQILPPFIVLSAMCFLLTNALTLFLLPKGNVDFRSHLFEIARRHSEAGLKERVFNEDFNDLILYVNQIDNQGERLKGILISDKREFEIPSLIVAQEGIIISDQDVMSITLRLFNGSIHRSPRGSKAYQEASFKTYDMNLPLGVEEPEEVRRIKYREMSLDKLFTVAEQRVKANKSTARLWIEVHKRFAYPSACIVFGLLGVSLGAYWRRGGRSYGFVLSLILIFLYYLLLSLGEAMAKRGVIFPFLGIWLPNIILGIAGLYLLSRVASETPIHFLNMIEENLNLVSEKIKQRLERRK
jgi:lipopolysaccharide export system permease protein